jgi:hypothetical protein
MKHRNKEKIIFFLIIFSLFLFNSCAKCPKSCNDFNECTRDFCDKSTDYECAHEQIPGCTCGNGQCEQDKGENECTCSRDCGQCEGEETDYTEYKCVNDMCVSKLKDSIEVLNQTLLRNFKTSVFNIDLKITYENPLNIEKSKVKAEFRLDDISDNIENFKITGITVYNSKQILMNEILFTEEMEDLGDSFEKIISLKGYQIPEEKNRRERSLYMEISYEYKQEYASEDRIKRESQKHSFGPLLLISAEID